MDEIRRTERPLHLSLDVDRDPAGRLEGRVRAPAAPAAVPFSGTLELLHVLEELVDENRQVDPTDALVPTDATTEATS